MAEKNYIQLHGEAYSWMEDAMYELREMAESFRHIGQTSTANHIGYILAKFKTAEKLYKEANEATFKSDMDRVNEASKNTHEFVLAMLDGAVNNDIKGKLQGA